MQIVINIPEELGRALPNGSMVPQETGKGSDSESASAEAKQEDEIRLGTFLSPRKRLVDLAEVGVEASSIRARSSDRTRCETFDPLC